MKKTLAILIALALVTTAASAQVAIKGSLKLGAAYAWGANYASTDNGSVSFYQDNVANVKFDSQAAATTQQANVEFKYTNGPAGMKINMRAVGAAKATAFGIDVAYVWLDLMDKKVKVLYGVTEDNTFRVGTYNQPDVDATYNAAVIYTTPVAGLTVGFNAQMPTPGSSTVITASATERYDLDVFVSQFGYAAKYVHPMFNVTLAYKGDNSGTAWAPNDDLIYWGAGFTGVKKLTLVTSGGLYKAFSNDKASYIQTESAASYMITEIIKAGVTVGTRSLTEAEDTINETAVDPNKKAASLYVLPAVTYSLSPSIALTLEGYYGMNEGRKADHVDMYVEPRVTYTVSDNAKIHMFYNYYSKNFDAPTGVKSKVTNIVGVDFLYTF